jgi:hypothetical protein
MGPVCSVGATSAAHGEVAPLRDGRRRLAPTPTHGGLMIGHTGLRQETKEWMREP